MKGANGASQDAYDVVVIGSGMAGLTAGSLLAKAGRKVLVVEAGRQPGGCLQAIRHGPYRFDSSVHLISGCTAGDGGYLDSLLSALGVRDECSFIPVDPMYTTVFPGFRFVAPAGREAFLEAHVRQFPNQARGFQRLLDRMCKIGREVLRYSTSWNCWMLLKAWWRLPWLLRDLRATVSEVTRQYLDDPRARAVIECLWPYCLLSPERLSFAIWAAMLEGYLERGAFYCRGSFQSIAEALVKGLRRQGGELLLDCRVRKIVVQNHRACGVVLADGRRIAAETIVANGDATQTFAELVGHEHLPGRFLRKLHRMRPGVSNFEVFLATDLDLRQAGWTYETGIAPTWGHEKMYREGCLGRSGPIGVRIPSLLDPGLAPSGQHVMIVTSLMHHTAGQPWGAAEEERFREKAIDELQRHIPEIRRHILHAEVLSPPRRVSLTANRDGAALGWEVSPDQVGLHRLPQRTPIEQLYLASHWTRPGAGVCGTAIAGEQVARQILGYRDPAQSFADSAN